MPTVAYRVTRSRRRFINAPKIRDYLGRGIDAEVKPHFLGEFKKVVANWDHKVEFAARKYITTDSIKVTVYPTSHQDIWTFVTGGTRPHIIRARNKKTLAFLWGGPGSYQAKTSAGGMAGYGGPGTVSGGTMHFPKQVNHPGTKARPFPKIIREQNQAWFSSTMNNIWRRAIRSL